MSLSPDKALAELCRRSFYRFVKEFIKVVINEDIVWNWHIKYLCDELQYLNSFVEKRQPKPYDLIINIPPGTSKSTIVNQMYNAWVWTRDPRQRFITSGYSSDLSLESSIKAKEIIQSAKYKRLFPYIKIKPYKDAKGNFENTEGGQRFTTSTGSTVTGIHGHQIINDDPLNPKQATSLKERQTANEFSGKTLSRRKVDQRIAPTITIMQRLHEEDPSGVILAKKGKKVKHINLPAKDDGSVKPKELSKYYVNGYLDNIRLNQEVLNEALLDLGSYSYAGQYQQRPAPAEGGIIKKDWFEIIEWKSEYNRLVWNFIADTAYTDKETNDPSGYISYAMYNNDFIIRMAETEYLEFPDLCRRLHSFVYQNGYTSRSIIKVEPKASGKSVVQQLRRQTNLNITETKAPKDGKEIRIRTNSPFIESRRVKLIVGNWNEQFISQICTFPNASHDEFIDCLNMMIEESINKRKEFRYNM